MRKNEAKEIMIFFVTLLMTSKQLIDYTKVIYFYSIILIPVLPHCVHPGTSAPLRV